MLPVEGTWWTNLDVAVCNVLFVQVREAAGALLKNSKDFVLLEPVFAIGATACRRSSIP